MGVLKLIVLSGFFIVLGVIVWRKNVVDFIAGYNQAVIHSPKSLARNIGIVIILFGIEMALLMTANLSGFEVNTNVIGVLAIVHIIAILLCFLYDRLQLHK